MAAVKFLNAAGKYDDPGARANVLAYMLQKAKTPSGFVGCCGVELGMAAEQMQALAESFKKDNKIRLRHFVISFYPAEIMMLRQVQWIADGICRELGQIYQTVYAVHEDTPNPHIHFVFNPVGYDGHKYSGTKEEHHDLKRLLRRHLDRHGVKMFYEVKYRPEAQDPYE